MKHLNLSMNHKNANAPLLINLNGILLSLQTLLKERVFGYLTSLSKFYKSRNNLWLLVSTSLIHS